MHWWISSWVRGGGHAGDTCIGGVVLGLGVVDMQGIHALVE